MTAKKWQIPSSDDEKEREEGEEGLEEEEDGDGFFYNGNSCSYNGGGSSKVLHVSLKVALEVLTNVTSLSRWLEAVELPLTQLL